MFTREVMTSKVSYLTPDATLNTAAKLMRDRNCGFLPIGGGRDNALMGVITDRDIAIRAVADGLSSTDTRVADIMSDHVSYCYADDPIEVTAKRMRAASVYRLIVLKSPENKRLCGVVSLGDILRHNRENVATAVAHGIQTAVHPQVA